MDTPHKSDRTTPGQLMSNQLPQRSIARFGAAEIDLARRLSALLGAPTTRAGEPWPLVRALTRLMDPHVEHGIDVHHGAITRDGEWALLSVDLIRRVGPWGLRIHVQCQIHAHEDTEDTQEETAVELRAPSGPVAIDCGVSLTEGEEDALAECVEAARAWVRDCCRGDAVDLAEERHG